MAQQRLVGHDQSAEMQVIIIEKIIDQIQIKGLLGGRNLGPFNLEMWRQTMFLFDLPQADGDFAGFVERAPDRTQNHGLLAVVFQMAGFVAVDIEGFAHGTSVFTSP